MDDYENYAGLPMQSTVSCKNPGLSKLSVLGQRPRSGLGNGSYQRIRFDHVPKLYRTLGICQILEGLLTALA